jgi:hypothetical protein
MSAVSVWVWTMMYLMLAGWINRHQHRENVDDFWFEQLSGPSQWLWSAGEPVIPLPERPCHGRPPCSRPWPDVVPKGIRRFTGSATSSRRRRGM